jgi:hypothetical protein
VGKQLPLTRLNENLRPSIYVLIAQALFSSGNKANNALLTNAPAINALITYAIKCSLPKKKELCAVNKNIPPISNFIINTDNTISPLKT